MYDSDVIYDAIPLIVVIVVESRPLPKQKPNGDGAKSRALSVKPHGK